MILVIWIHSDIFTMHVTNDMFSISLATVSITAVDVLVQLSISPTDVNQLQSRSHRSCRRDEWSFDVSIPSSVSDIFSQYNFLFRCKYGHAVALGAGRWSKDVCRMKWIMQNVVNQRYVWVKVTVNRSSSIISWKDTSRPTRLQQRVTENYVIMAGYMERHGSAGKFVNL